MLGDVVGDALDAAVQPERQAVARLVDRLNDLVEMPALVCLLYTFPSQRDSTQFCCPSSVWKKKSYYF